jgi:RNA polymerase sigma-70 factor, ECF subfamily
MSPARNKSPARRVMMGSDTGQVQSMSGAIFPTRAQDMCWGADGAVEVTPRSGKRARPRGEDAALARPGQALPMAVHGQADSALPDGNGAASAEARTGFRDLMLPHLDAAYNLARYLARDEDIAQDIVQEAFVRALRAFGTYRGENAKAWLLAIVRNVFLTEARARGSGRTVSLEAYLGGDREPDEPGREIWDPDQETPETALLRSDESRCMRDLIEALPVPFRETLVLRELEELSYQQIATATGAPIGTVMSRLARAREMLERMWRGRHDSNREQRA